MADSDTSHHRWYPLFLDLRGRRVLVAGGDATAARKTRRLLDAGARVELVAPDLCDTLQQWLHEGVVSWAGPRLRTEQVQGLALLLVTERNLFTRIRARVLAERHAVPINVVDDPGRSTAYMPAVVDRHPVIVAIGTGGRAPELARMLRSRIEAQLPAATGPLAALAGGLQQRIRRRFPGLGARRQFLHWLFTGAPSRALEAGRTNDARRLAEDRLADRQFAPRGSVALVGAGPGDPELLTVRALRLIQAADVIIHDGLVDARVLEYARRDAECIDVAKRSGGCATTQDSIHSLLALHAGHGRRVVRLKGGDPMVFGRGGEELAYLKARGIACQVVPGITAAVACGAYAGIPLTHRAHAQSVRLVTAHCAASIDRLNWHDLAGDRQTLAFYMAVARLEHIRDRLLQHGRSPATPVALVENGTRPDQRVITGDLDNLARIARSNQVQSPAMLFVGEVAVFARTLGWFGPDAHHPASGQASSITRPPAVARASTNSGLS